MREVELRHMREDLLTGNDAVEAQEIGKQAAALIAAVRAREQVLLSAGGQRRHEMELKVTTLLDRHTSALEGNFSEDVLQDLALAPFPSFPSSQGSDEGQNSLHVVMSAIEMWQNQQDPSAEGKEQQNRNSRHEEDSLALRESVVIEFPNEHYDEAKNEPKWSPQPERHAEGKPRKRSSIKQRAEDSRALSPSTAILTASPSLAERQVWNLDIM
jgi:hypothetical protein